VQRAFDRLLVGRTTIVIAHRLATVRRASKVVVIEAGRIHGEGPHDELVASDALYRRLCELQLLTGSAPAAS
jgi:ABC-type multidrug transport system fused ATPase/permease subunit